MKYSPDVSKMLGQSRVDRIQKCITSMQAYMASVPDYASWAKHLPIPLESSDPIAIKRELIDRFRKEEGEWFFMLGPQINEVPHAFASNLFRPQQPNSDDNPRQFLVFDLHASLGCWWLSHLWRATDLAEAAFFNLAEWSILPAAACARALVEGIAAFVIEGEQLLTEWSEFKQRGVPGLSALGEFRDNLDRRLFQVQFGTRISEITERDQLHLKRTNVLTLLEKFAKRVDDNLLISYEWLCDAVHPSFGFHTTYTVAQGGHRSKSHIARDIARRTDRTLSRVKKTDPNVAWTVADVLIISVDAFLTEAPRLRWLIDDFGLTTGVAFVALDYSVGKTVRLSNTANCPCGSGLYLEDCYHTWGKPAEPPIKQTSKDAR